MPARKLWAVASLEVYPIGQGDPIMSDRGFGMYEILRDTYQTAEYDYNSKRLPRLEFIEDIGLTNRMLPNYRNTRLSDFDFADATNWDEIQPTTNYYVRMFNNSPGIVESATTKVAFPQNPQFAIELDILDTPTDWDGASLPAQIEIQLGPSAEWSILIDKNSGNYFLKSGQSIGSLGSLEQNRDRGSGMIFVRWNRGQILVSMDGGKTYSKFGNPDQPAIIHSAKLKIKSQGQAFGLGIQELTPETGWIRGRERNTFKTRFATEIITGRYDATDGTSVAFADIHVGTNTARWQATLTPIRVVTFPFNFWVTPSLYSVTVRYPFIRVVDTSVTVETPFDAYILQVTYDGGDSLLDSSATVTLHQKAYDDFGNLDNWHDRKVKIKTGWKWSDDSVTWDKHLVGYVQAANLVWDGFNSVTVNMTIENSLIPLKKEQWTPLDVVPFGGLTPTAIGDYHLKSIGFMDEAGADTTRRAWSGLNGSATIPLDWGYPEDPFELVRPREYKIESLTRIFGYRGLDIGADDDGIIFDVLKEWVDQTDPLDFYPNSQTTNDIEKHFKRVSSGIDFRNSATTIMVFGQAPNGDTIMLMNVDDQAELNPASGRFAPFRSVVQEDISGTANPYDLIQRANSLAAQYFPRDNRGDGTIRYNGLIPRRKKIIVHNCQGIGIPDGAEYVARTIRHNVVNRGTSETTIGIKLL